MDTNLISLIASGVAILISIYALWRQNESEKRGLRISFLLPELSEIITTLRSMKVKEVNDGRPDDQSMKKFFDEAKDICFRKEHIFKGIGLNQHVDVIINEHNHSDEQINEAFRGLFSALDEKYQQIIGTKNVL